MKTGLNIKKDLRGFEDRLRSEEKSAGTIEKYLHDITAFADWLGERELTKEAAAAWKKHLLSDKYAPVTINSMLAAVNRYCIFAEMNIKIRYLKIQRRLFREPSKELSRGEYDLLIKTARSCGKERLALLMETICACGIRVSEVKYITVEAAQHGQATILLKGKIRSILLPGKLCRKLCKYAKKQKIASGEIFLTRSGKSISRRQIWAEMKRLCKKAGVAETKVFPHNLRHLFATVFYKACKDIVRLADVLGHSCIDTTRLYVLTIGTEHRRQLEHLRLVT